jgi:hypothetical protein
MLLMLAEAIVRVGKTFQRVSTIESYPKKGIP